jgi:hypothetical protein
MRRSALLFLCSLPPSSVLATGCFGQSQSNPKADASFGDAQNEASFFQDAGGRSDATADQAVDATGTDVAEAAADQSAPDSPPDSPGGDGGGSFPTGTLDFGLIDCGGRPTADQTYSFTNTGSSSITYSASVGSSTLFAIQGLSAGVVDPGDTGTITIAGLTVPATSTAGTPLTGTLTLTTDVPGYTTVTVPLQVTPQGGSFTVSPIPVAFGSQQLTQSMSLPFVLTNVGNAPVSVTFGAATDGEFSIGYTGSPSATSIPVNGTLAGAQVVFDPSSSCQKNATATIQTTGAMCATAATTVTMSGSGTTEPVTVGPDPLNFNSVACGSTAAAQPVTITNGYAFAITYTAALTAGTYYGLSSMSGSVPANGQASITVTPKPIPAIASTAAGAFDDTLTVTTNAPATSPFVIPVDETASGAILKLTMANTSFGPVAAGTTGTLPFTVTNSGNLAAPLTLTPGGAGYGAVFTSSSTAGAGGGTSTGNATYSPQSLGDTSGSLTVSTTAVQCGTPLGAVTLSADGTSPVATYSATPLTPSATCGSGAGAQVSLTVSNTTTTGNTLDLSNVKSVNGDFTVVSFPATIAAGSKGAIVIEVNPVIGTTAAGSYTDTLEFTTNELGNPTHSVTVDVTVNGANFIFSAGGTQDITTCGVTTPSYTIENTGNMAATITQPATEADIIRFDGIGPQGGPSASIGVGDTAIGSFTIIENEPPTSVCDTNGPVIFDLTSTGQPVCVGTPLGLSLSWDIPASFGCPNSNCC